MRQIDEIVQLVRCPVCGEPVVADGADLRCSQEHLVPQRDGYWDAAGVGSGQPADQETLRTASSFGYEWTTFDALEPEDEDYWNMYFQDVPLEAYAGRLALDAGCGKGRYSYFTARHARALAAVDNSDAVEAAARNLSSCDNVAVMKADLRALPFADEAFEFISCLGVLHHLTDPEAGFQGLVRLLRPGGHVLLYLYSTDPSFTLRSLGHAAAAHLRRVTVRLPHRALRALSAPLAAALYAGVVWPGQLGARAGIEPLRRLPLANYRAMPVRTLWLDTFDRLSAPLEHRYTQEQVDSWFRQAGVDLLAIREQAGLFVVGRKPAAGSAR